MGRPSAANAKKKQVENTLRVELQRQIEQGQCVYCRAPAGPDQPLTREHVIPRARGGRRNDLRIIVAACLRCNSHRGCGELVPFLLDRPTRISSFLDYLSTLSEDSLRQLDPRIFAELYAAVAILREAILRGQEWRQELDRLSSGRPLHRRRHAARRALWSITHRVGEPGSGGENRTLRRSDSAPPPPASTPDTAPTPLNESLDEPLELLAARVVAMLALLWGVTTLKAESEITRALAGSALDRAAGRAVQYGDEPAEDIDILPLDSWRSRPRKRRLRVDRRQGRAVRGSRGRAA